MSDVFNSLLRIFDLEKIEEDIYRGRSPDTSWQRIFGGQTIAQALVAAQRTVAPDRLAHSLHCYFMLGGDPTVPIVYSVDRIRDGRSFNTRRVLATQHGRAIFSLEASFQIEEPGLDHQITMPDIPQPEALASQRELTETLGDKLPEVIRRFWERERPIELRPAIVEHYTSRERLAPVQHMWVRFAATPPDDPALRRILLAYMSDLTLLDTSTFAHGRVIFDKDIQAASLDHAMWFHRDHALDDWILYTQDSPSTSGARGFTRGSLFARDGTLIASVAQEGLIRLRRKAQ
ncbi:MAG: acyl-CoA thioesterase II [Rhizobiaceae bacterium]|nr:acyl-CoA thioesterase II [Rhizobiaceae bacterium]